MTTRLGRRLDRRLAALARTAAVLGVLAASSGCRSLLPQENDSTPTQIAKGVVLVPACIGLWITDDVLTDRYGVSVDDFTTDAAQDAERFDRVEHSRLLERDLHRP